MVVVICNYDSSAQLFLFLLLWPSLILNNNNNNMLGMCSPDDDIGATQEEGQNDVETETSTRYQVDLSESL